MSVKNSGMFGICDGFLKDGKFKNYTEDEKMACCLTSCKSEINQCLDTCYENYGPDKEQSNELYIDCRNNCSRILLSCSNACRDINKIQNVNSPMVKCIESNGCGDFPRFDKKCIESNANTIKSCCISSCIPSPVMNCNKHCNLKYLDFIGKSKSPLIHMYDTNPKFTGDPFKHKNHKKGKTLIIFLSISLTICICFGIFILIKR